MTATASSEIPSQPAPPPGDSAAATAQEGGQEKRPSNLWVVLADNRTVWMPWGWMATADVAAITAHYATPNLLWTFLTAAGSSVLASAWAMWRSREARLTQMIKTLKTIRRVQVNVKRAVVAGALWELVASMWTPFGPHGLVQLALLFGGHVIAYPHWRRTRRQVEAEIPVAEIEAPKPKDDERLTQFRTHFCQSGPLRDAELRLARVGGGFRLTVAPLLANRGTYTDVKRLEEQIAALYDVPLDQVSVEPPESRSHRRAVVTVLTEAKAHERDQAWDGRSSYDPKTGCVDLGRFADGSPSHYQLHIPGNGATCGLVGGVQGSGKSGTLHVVSCEAGQAKLCVECLAECSCQQCRMRRICAVWMGDPQRQPFGVWRGRADVTAWGPLSCVRMLSWLHAAMRTRADFFGRMEWTDHIGRTNTGKGWFDPSPQFPLLLGVITEWPIITKDPELRSFALPLAEQIGDEGRKVGVELLFDLQDADVKVLGERGLRNALTAYNAVAHQGDQYLGRMLGVDGNPENLPQGVHGVSYLRGYDKRSDITHRTKHLPEYLRPGQKGVDVREITERIARDPIVYDEAVIQAISALGYTGPGQILDDEDGWDLESLNPDRQEPEPEPARHTKAAPSAFNPVASHAAEAVRDALSGHLSIDLFDAMKATGLSALDVSRAFDELIAAGIATQQPSGRYAPCS